MGFDGFPEQTLGFLAGIREHNDKGWFEAHRADYETGYVDAGRQFVLAAFEALHAVAPGVRAEPRVLGSLARINRDIRFSPDKRPYKDHLDLWLWEGDRKSAPSGFWFRLTPEVVMFGTGAHGFDKARLARYRDAVVDPVAGRVLAAAVRAVESAGYEVQAESLRRVPAGYEPSDDGQSRLLRFSSLFTGDDEPVGPWVHGPEVLDRALGHWKKMLPLHRWLVDHLP